MKHRFSLGMTLLEIMLVLVIGSAVLIIGLNQYYSFQAEQEMIKLKANIDAVFQAMGRYYQAHCRKMDIFSPALVAVPFSTLQTEGYVSSLLPTLLIDSTVGYITQFNSVDSTRQVYFHYKPASLLVEPSPIRHLNTVRVWKMQVSVKIADPKKLSLYQNLLAAQCISSPSEAYSPPLPIIPCDKDPVAGGYLVWERWPSFSSRSASSALWPTLSQLRQFDQQDVNDDYYAYVYYSPADDKSSEYYTCGG